MISCSRPFTDDQTRVRLMPYEGVDGSDYINANYVDVSCSIVSCSWQQCDTVKLLCWLWALFHTALPIVYKFFKGSNFHGWLKSRISVVLFPRIIYQPLCSISIVTVLKNFEGLIFVDDKVPTKAAKLKPLENLYVYSMYSALPVEHWRALTYSMYSALPVEHWRALTCTSTFGNQDIVHIICH